MITDEVFNSLEWKEIKGNKLDDLIKGMTVAGAEPMCLPFLCGVTLYLEKKGRLYALQIAASDDRVDEVYLQWATVPTVKESE